MPRSGSFVTTSSAPPQDHKIEAGGLAEDWRGGARTRLSTHGWPASLKIPFEIALGCSFPTILWHGREFATYFNEAALPIIGRLGYGASGLPGSEALSENWSEIGPIVQRAFAAGEPQSLQGWLLPAEDHRDRRCYSFSFSPIRDEAGIVTGVQGIAMEIGDRADCDGRPAHSDTACAASLEMRAREQRLSAFLEHGAVIGFLKDAGGRYEYLSPTFEKRYKVRQADWLGKTDFEVWPKAIAESFVAADHAVLSTGGHIEVVERAPDPDGVDAWWLTNKFAFCDALGRLHLGGLAVDITDLKLAEEALSASEEKRKLGAAVAGLALADVDYKTDRILLSLEAARLFGLGEEAMQLPRAAVHATFHPEDRAHLMDCIQASLDPAGPGWFAMDHRIVTSKGDVRWLRVRKQVFFEGIGPARRPSHAMLAVFDVTVEKAAEEAAHRNEAFVSEALDALPQQVAVLDESGKLISVNEAWRQFACENDASASTPSPNANYLEVCRNAASAGDEFARRALEGLSRLLSGASDAFQIEYPCHSPTEPRWFVMHARRLRLGAILSHTDITQQKKAEEAVRESELRFRAIAELNPDAILVSVDGRYVYANRAAVELLKARDADEILGITPFDVVAPPFHDLLRRRIRTAVEENHVDPLREYQWVTRTGALVDVEVGTGPVSWLGKRGVQAVARDVTDRKRGEAALREADRRKDEFLATLAHELRNPLSPIANGVHILLRSETIAALPERRRALLEMMKRQVSHLVRLVDDLVEISRISQGKVEIRREAADCVALIKNAIEICQPLVEERGHRLTVEFPAQPLTVEVDPIRLTQVIANLINNAANYTQRGGRIHVTARRLSDEAVISVQDDGMGIAPDMLPRVFELFTQIDQSSKGSRNGLGIGLALVRQLVTLHGGRVTAHSDGSGCGSEFVVHLPLGGNSTGSGKRADAPSLRGGLRALVVDDDQDVGDSFGLLLETLGVSARVVRDGASGVAAIDAFRPDVAFVDLGMPLMDGYETASRMRQAMAGRKVTLVALSGWGQEEDRRRTREAGFDLHVTKPASIEVLEDLLRVLSEPPIGG